MEGSSARATVGGLDVEIRRGGRRRDRAAGRRPGRRRRTTGIAFAAHAGERFVGPRRALERRRLRRAGGRELRRRRAVPRGGPQLRQGRHAAVGRPRPRRRDVLPDPVGPVQPRRRRPARQRRDQPLPLRRRRRGARRSTRRSSALRVFAGPEPAQALRRFTGAVGRQPPPATPWSFGPWFQTGQPNVVRARGREADHRRAARGRRARLRGRDADALPAVRRAPRQRGLRARAQRAVPRRGPRAPRVPEPAPVPELRAGVLGGGERGRAAARARRRLAVHVPRVRRRQRARRVHLRAARAVRLLARRTPGRSTSGSLRELFDAGKDGWMEDFGEYTPPLAVSADGTPGARMHNRFPTTYHCAVRDIAATLPRPVSRHQRSGWTGSAACADIVWGGDPTTVWGYDGLQSVVTQALSMGLSGVSRWGTDIGGYHSFGPAERLDAEMLRRWIQVGAVSARDADEAVGDRRPLVHAPAGVRPRDPAGLAALHEAPHAAAPVPARRRPRLPRHRPAAHAPPPARRIPATRARRPRDDQFLFGPDLLAAPVTTPGERERRLYAPAGTWVDFWRSVTFRESDGAFLPRGAAAAGRRRRARPARTRGRAAAARARGRGAADAARRRRHARPVRRPTASSAARSRAGRMTLLAFPRGRSTRADRRGRAARLDRGPPPPLGALGPRRAPRAPTRSAPRSGRCTARSARGGSRSRGRRLSGRRGPTTWRRACSRSRRACAAGRVRVEGRVRR